MGLALFRISLWCLPVICAPGSVKLLDHSPLVIIPLPLSYLQGAHRAQRLLCVGVLGRQALFPDAELTCLSEGFGFFFFCLLAASLPPCSLLWHINEILARKDHPKAQEHQPQAGSQTLHKIGSLETVLVEDVNHTITLYCGPAQLSSVCSRIVQLCLWAKRFLVFISAAPWAP